MKLIFNKKLLNKEICESREQCMGSTENSHALFNQKKKVENADINAGKRKTRFPNAYLVSQN